MSSCHVCQSFPQVTCSKVPSHALVTAGAHYVSKSEKEIHLLCFFGPSHYTSCRFSLGYHLSLNSLPFRQYTIILSPIHRTTASWPAKPCQLCVPGVARTLGPCVPHSHARRLDGSRRLVESLFSSSNLVLGLPLL